MPETLQLAAGGDIPEPGGAVAAGGQKFLAIGRDSDRLDPGMGVSHESRCLDIGLERRM